MESAECLTCWEQELWAAQKTDYDFSRGSEGAKRGPKNENLHILAVLTPETAPGAVVIKT